VPSYKGDKKKKNKKNKNKVKKNKIQEVTVESTKFKMEAQANGHVKHVDKTENGKKKSWIKDLWRYVSTLMEKQKHKK